MKLSSLVSSIDAFLSRLGGGLQAPLLLAVRLYWGWGFARTGWGKLMHWERTTEYFASLGIPAAKLNAGMAGGVECLGGILLALGLFGRWAAAGLATVMLVAYATAEREALSAIWSEPDQFTAAEPFLFLLAAVLVLVFGPGKWSLDAIARKAK